MQCLLLGQLVTDLGLTPLGLPDLGLLLGFPLHQWRRNTLRSLLLLIGIVTLWRIGRRTIHLPVYAWLRELWPCSCPSELKKVLGFLGNQRLRRAAVVFILSP